MKAEIILAIIWMSLCVCERQQRSTVLTDEYKRVLEHFDFSNFDKQEALNYIDRQRYENQIRGKRSHSKFKRDHAKAGKISDMTAKENDFPNNNEINDAIITNSKSQICEKLKDEKQIHVPEFSNENEWSINETSNLSACRRKRGHRGKKKHKSKYVQRNSDMEEEDMEGDECILRRHHKRKKKKKRKRHYWDHWSEWSPCSVTCGRGRKIRWRKCIVKNCTTGELEMGEKTCQLPACNLLTKLLGL